MIPNEELPLDLLIVRNIYMELGFYIQCNCLIGSNDGASCKHSCYIWNNERSNRVGFSYKTHKSFLSRF